MHFNSELRLMLAVPCVVSQDPETGKSRISKRGNREVRRRLYEATLSAARYNPSVRAIYRRLKESGKSEKVARTAAARKLLVIAHAIYKSGESFRQPDQEEA